MTNEPQIDWPERLREWCNSFRYPSEDPPYDQAKGTLSAYDRMKGERDKLKQWQKEALEYVVCSPSSDRSITALRLQKEAE